MISTSPKTKSELVDLLRKLEEKRRKYSWKYKLIRPFVSFNAFLLYTAGIGALLIGTGFLAFIGIPIVVITLTALIIPNVIYTYVLKAPDQTYNHYFKTEFMPAFLKLVNPGLVYEPKKSFSKDIMQNMLIFSSYIEGVWGEDMIKGEFKNVPFAMCDMVIFREERITVKKALMWLFFNVLMLIVWIMGHDPYGDPAGNDGEAGPPVERMFGGLVMRAGFHKEMQGHVVVIPKKKLGTRLFKRSRYNSLPSVQMDNGSFNEMYAVFATDGFNANYALSPAIMERMVKMSTEQKSAIYFSIVNSVLNVAIETNYDFLEGRVTKKIDPESDAHYFVSEFEFFGSIITDLQQDTRIWGDRAM